MAWQQWKRVQRSRVDGTVKARQERIGSKTIGVARIRVDGTGRAAMERFKF